MTEGDVSSTSRAETSFDDSTLTRRTVMGLLGIGGAGAMLAGTAGADNDEFGSGSTRKWNQHIDAQGHDLSNLHSIDMGHVFTAARDADVIVWKDESGTFHADGHDGHVASGEDVMVVAQAAVDSLTEGRDWKEKVAIVSSGTVPDDTDDRKTIELPSYTILDVPATIDVEHESGEDTSDVVVRAVDEHHIEIPRLTVTGGPWMAIRLRSCSNVRLGDITVEFSETSSANDAIRIDDGGENGRCEDVQLNSAYVEHSTQHAVETAGVDRFQAGQVIGKNLEGCAVLLNDTQDATVNSVIGKDPFGGYATLRLANGNENVSIGNVVARGGHRGIAIITDARNVTVGEVNISHTNWHGIQLVDAKNVTIGGGVIRNCGDSAVTIYSHLGDPTNEGITLSNLRIVDDRPESEREQPWAIHEDGDSQYNRFIDNDIRDGGTEGLIRTGSETTVVRDNVGGGVDEGYVSLESGASPAARIEGVDHAPSATLEARVSALEGPDGTFAVDTEFVWDGDDDEWDLIFEWGHDPGTDLEVAYAVDRNQPNLVGVPGGSDGGPPAEWNPDEVDQEEGPGVVDDFEDGDVSEYVGATGNYEVTDDAPIADGEYSLKQTSSGASIIGSFGGLPRYPAAGDEFVARVAQTDVTSFVGVAFGMQDTANFYFARLDANTDSWQIWKVENGDYDELAGTDLELDDEGTVYEAVVDWSEDGEITADLQTTDGEVKASVTATDTTYTDGGIGARSSGMLDGIEIR